MPHVLAFDLGTTHFKAAVFDDAGRTMATASVPTPITRPRPGWVEIHPPAFKEALIGLTQDMRDKVPGSLEGVAGISFASQANSFLLLDQRDHPLTPIIVWSDQRACQADFGLDSSAPTTSRYEQTGIPVSGHLFAPAKLRWLRQHQPDPWSQARRFCLISDYLSLWLTGRHVTEAGLAGLTGIVDIHQPGWIDSATTRIGLPDDAWPKVLRAGDKIGQIRGDTASQLGVPATCAVINGCLDQYAGAVGAGNVIPGGVSETTGTVLATVRCADRFETQLFDRGIFQGPGVVAGHYFQMCFGDTSANLLEKYRAQLPGTPDYETLSRWAREAGGSAGLRLGQVDSSDSPPSFPGRQPHHTRGNEVYAIFEAVARALKEQVAQLTGGEALPSVIRSVGGAARSDLWLTIKADITGIPVSPVECIEPTCMGSAVLAASRLATRSIDEIARLWVRQRELVRPVRI